MGLAWLPFGVLRRPHGIKGEIFLAVFNGASSQLEKQTLPLAVRIVRGQEIREVELCAARPVHDGFLARFRGSDDREAVAELVGWEVHLLREALAPLASGEFYVEDLVGCEVFAVGGQALGQVRGVLWNGAQDVISVVAPDGCERLLPVVEQFVHSFDPERRHLIVDPHE